MLELPKSTAEWRSALPKILQINGDEIDQINKVFGSLSMDLRTMKNLPLIVTNIHGISPYLRGTEPPLPSIFVSEQNCEVSEDETHRVPSRDKLPRYTPVVTVHLKLEHSTKWGSDLDAIQGLTSSFYLQMAKEFQRLNTFSVPTENQLFVMRENIVFELVIVHDRIGTLLESFIEKQKSQGVQVETELILKLQDYRKRFIYDSALQASLFSFAVVHKTFPDVVRIMKRWLGAKLLSGHIPDLVLELLCAAVFIDSSQTQPRSAWAAFRRVLQLLTTHNWTAQPLLVDLDQAWDEEQITDMRKSFVKMRPVLPPMVIMTNEDTVGSRWSYGGPSPLILKRMIGLAKDTVAVLDNHIESDMALKLTDALMFRDLSPYDCVIEIRDEAVVRELAPEQENEETEKEQKTKEGNLDKVFFFTFIKSNKEIEIGNSRFDL
ncbi:hypothetical protein WR25_26490 [Diploscapter pachys]|uniref:Nucleolar protein 6 n=1 Tax=Diploscapter pachys TaxID=2018661 RepID=A0A2A2KRM4_9BILA|nr:hypothetical protein WR25_26490 [Diploscapter pachys]